MHGSEELLFLSGRRISSADHAIMSSNMEQSKKKMEDKLKVMEETIKNLRTQL